MDQKDRTVSFAPSIISMITGVAADAKELLISELTLTKLEFQREFVKATAAAVAVALGIGFGFVGAISLVFMVVHLLADFTMVPLWGCFGIVGGAFVLLGALVATSGKIKSNDIKLLPRSTNEIKKDFVP